MRICQFSLCDEAATVWFRGESFCGAHALKRWGRRDVVLAARFSELHRALEASRSMDPCPPQVDRGEGSGGPLSPVSRPRGRASAAASVAASEPGLISDQELDDLLETEGWSEWEGW